MKEKITETEFLYKLYDTKLIYRQVPYYMRKFPILIQPGARKIIYTTDENDYEIILFDLFTNNKWKIGEHEDSFISLSQSIDGNKLMSYTVDGVIKLWEISKKNLIYSFKIDDYKFEYLDQYFDYSEYYNYPDYYLKISPDSSYFICFNDKFEHGRFEIWDLENKNISRFIDLDCSMWDFKISLDSKRIAYLTNENSIHIVDLNLSVKEIKFRLFRDDENINDFLFYNNDKILVVHSGKIIQEFDINGGKEINMHDFSTIIVKNEETYIYNVSNIFDESKIAIVFGGLSIESGYELMIYDLGEKVPLKRFEIVDNESKSGKIKQICVSPEGDIILAYFDYDFDNDAIKIWVDVNKFHMIE